MGVAHYTVGTELVLKFCVQHVVHGCVPGPSFRKMYFCEQLVMIDFIGSVNGLGTNAVNTMQLAAWQLAILMYLCPRSAVRKVKVCVTSLTS